MKLYEYEAKNILKAYDIPIPHGGLAGNSVEAQQIAAGLRSPFVIKSQVLVAGRGKAGGIVFAQDTHDVKQAVERLFSLQINGITVKRVLVEERIPIARELYFGITVDRFERKYAILASTLGGMDIEEAAKQSPRSIVKTLVQPQTGFNILDAQKMVEKLGYHDNRQIELTQVLASLYQIAMDYDVELIETNPLVETTDSRFVAVDARLIIDDNALFKHPELERLSLTEIRDGTLEEIEAKKHGLAYVKLNGNIGVIGNGAGLVMATLDLIQYYGGVAADFLDLGGGSPVERIAKAIEIVVSDVDVKVVLINVLGGITHCDEVARAIVQTRFGIPMSKSFVVRLVGTNENEGRQILMASHIVVLDSMEEAAKHAVDIAKRNIKWE